MHKPLIEHCVRLDAVTLDENTPSVYESVYIGCDKERGHPLDQPGPSPGECPCATAEASALPRPSSHYSEMRSMPPEPVSAKIEVFPPRPMVPCTSLRVTSPSTG